MNTSSLNSKEITQTSGSNFVSSFWFLPAPKQQALTAIYAYCRLTDDLVDLAPNKETAQQQIKMWREQTQQILTAQPQHPVLQDLAQVSKTYKIPLDYYLQLIDGVEMDLEKTDYATFEELYQYCYRVASIVGLMCLQVFEFKNLKSKQYAIELGLAFQITNILRDVKTDLERGRIYLPKEDLKKFDLSSDDLKKLTQNSPSNELLKKFKDLIQFECNRAEMFYQKSLAQLTKEDRPNFIAAEMMTTIYHSILKKIKANPLIVLKSKVRIPKFIMLIKILTTWVAHQLNL